MPISTIHDIRSADDCGLFSQAGTQISTRIYPVQLGAFFVASRRVGTGRYYHVYFCSDEGKISGPFGGAVLRDNQAHTDARSLARGYGWSNLLDNPTCTRCGFAYETGGTLPPHALPDGGLAKCPGSTPALLFCIPCDRPTEHEREATLPEEYKCGEPDYEDRSKCGLCGETYQCPVCGAPWDVERNGCAAIISDGPAAHEVTAS